MNGGLIGLPVNAEIRGVFYTLAVFGGNLFMAGAFNLIYAVLP
jgi:hypothetical protein